MGLEGFHHKIEKINNFHFFIHADTPGPQICLTPGAAGYNDFSTRVLGLLKTLLGGPLGKVLKPGKSSSASAAAPGIFLDPLHFNKLNSGN